jgi:hypothetical protein
MENVGTSIERATTPFWGMEYFVCQDKISEEQFWLYS